jgi:ABC-2 type transport system permease protein
MRSFISIALNAFLELVRQPIYLILLLSSVSFMMVLSNIYYFGLGEDTKLVKDSVLATLFLSGIFGAVIGATASVAEEIRSGTALSVLSKPIGRVKFLTAKYLGLVAAISLHSYICALAVLLASRMGFDTYGSPDYLALGIFMGAVGLACFYGLVTNFFMGRPFVGQTVLALLLTTSIAFIAINFVDKEGHSQTFGRLIDWRLIPATTLILSALWVLAAIALACTTRFELIPTLLICSGVFLLGLMSDYLFGRVAAEGVWWAKIVYAVLPNWQLFWMADALAEAKSIPWSYVAKVGQYVVTSLILSLGLALLMFEDRELS